MTTQIADDFSSGKSAFNERSVSHSETEPGNLQDRAVKGFESDSFRKAGAVSDSRSPADQRPAETADVNNTPQPAPTLQQQSTVSSFSVDGIPTATIDQMVKDGLAVYVPERTFWDGTLPHGYAFVASMIGNEVHTYILQAGEIHVHSPWRGNLTKEDGYKIIWQNDGAPIDESKIGDPDYIAKVLDDYKRTRRTMLRRRS